MLIRLSILSTITLATVAALLASLALAKEGCTWYLNGPFLLQQSNGIALTVKLAQGSKGKLTGAGEVDQHFAGKATGPLEGAVDGDNVRFTIYWQAGNAVGEYTGSINDHGRMEGTTRDRFNPTSTASWYSAEHVSCLLDERKAPPKTPKAPAPGKAIQSPGKFFQP